MLSRAVVTKFLHRNECLLLSLAAVCGMVNLSVSPSNGLGGRLMVEIRCRVGVLALFVVDRSSPGSFAVIAWVVSDRMLMQTVLYSL